MRKYSISRFWLLKVVVIGLISGLLLISTVWFLLYAQMDSSRRERTEIYASQFTEDVAYVQAPVFRTDIPIDLSSYTAKEVYYTADQVSQLRSLDFIAKVTPLVGSPGDSEKFAISDFVKDIGVGNEEALGFYRPVEFDMLPDDYFDNWDNLLVSGSYPQDNTNQVLIANSFSNYNIGDSIEIDGIEYTVSGIIEASEKIICFPFTDGNYENLYYPQTLEALESVTHDQVSGLVYGDMLLSFKSKPTNKELDEVMELLPGAAIYYSGYTESKVNQVEYIKLSLLKNQELLTFTISTAVLLISILKLILGRENLKLRQFKIKSSVLKQIKRYEEGQLFVIYISMMTILYFSLYGPQALDWTNFYFVVLCLYMLVIILSTILATIVKMIWGNDDKY